jgi:copper chaperone CopZ
MKKIITIIIIVLAGSRAMAQFNSANLQAAGLTCAMCTKAINNSLEKLSFIQSVSADIKSSSFHIAFKKEVSVDFDLIKKAVNDAGFSVARLNVTGTFSGVAVQNDTHVQIDGKTFHFLNISNQTLSGEKTLLITDKDFIGGKEFKKYHSATQMPCVQTGRAGSCCIKDGIKESTRIYHVTI